MIRLHVALAGMLAILASLAGAIDTLFAPRILKKAWDKG